MPTNGQVAVGPNGERAVYQNGQWIVPQSAAPRGPPADPTFNLQAPKVVAATNRDVAATNEITATTPGKVAGQAIDNTVAAGTAPAKIATAESEAEIKRKEAEETDALGRLNALVGQINTTQDLFNKGPGTTEGAAGIRDLLPGAVNQGAAAFDKAAGTLEDVAIGAFKVPGMGSTSDADAARMAAAIRPSRWTPDAGTQQQFQDTRNRVDAWFKTRGLPTPQWVAPTGAATPAAREAAQKAPQTWNESPLSQGMSGINEGIAGTIGLPVDLTTAGLNLGIGGFNKLTNAGVPTIEHPFLGGETFKDWGRQAGMIGDESADPTNQFTRRAAQSVGASLLPIGAVGGAGGQVAKSLLSAGAGGVGAATAQQAFPGNPIAELTGEVAGSMLGGGAGMLHTRAANREAAIEAVPSIADLRRQASGLYDAAEARGVVGSARLSTDLANRFRRIAQNENVIFPNGDISPKYTDVAAALKMIDAHAGSPMSAAQIGAIRKTLGDAAFGSTSNEQRIMNMLLEEFDNSTIPLAPEFVQARDVASRYLRAGQIQKQIDLSDVRTNQFSQSGRENALRTDFRKLDRQIINGETSFGPNTTAAIRRVDRGTPYRNTMRGVGKFAVRGPVSGGVTALGGPAVAASIGLPPAAGMVATAGVGEIAHRLATRAVETDARVAEALARSGDNLNVAPTLSDEVARLLAAQSISQLGQYVAPDGPTPEEEAAGLVGSVTDTGDYRRAR